MAVVTLRGDDVMLFLRAHPEARPDLSWVGPAADPRLAATVRGVVAFLTWVGETGRMPDRRVRRLLEFLGRAAVTAEGDGSAAVR